MAKPKNKEELLDACISNFEKLTTFVDSLDEKIQGKSFDGDSLNRNIRDVYAHLYHWHGMFFNWYDVGMKGQKPDMPSKGYTWKDTSKLNKEINLMYQKSTLKEIKRVLIKSHRKSLALIKKHSNEELFEKKRYHWTGSTSLGAYLISSTASHYHWALKLIKRSIKERRSC